MARYLDPSDLRARIEKDDTTTGPEDIWIDAVCEAACDAVDAYTHRTFTLAASVSARRYSPIGRLLQVDDIATLTGLVVAVGFLGSYTDTLTINVEYEVYPPNAIALGRPVTALAGYWPHGSNTVQVTAKWGWAAVPKSVTAAALIKAHALYRRKDSPEGIAGLDGYGPIRVSKYEDPTYQMLLSPYCVSPVLVA